MDEEILGTYRLRSKIFDASKEIASKYGIERIHKGFLTEVIDCAITETHKNVDRIILKNMKEKLEKLIVDS